MRGAGGAGRAGRAGRGAPAAWRGAPRRASLVPVVGSEVSDSGSRPRRAAARSRSAPPPPAPTMDTQSQDAASPAELPNDPGKMFVGGLSWQTSPGKSLKEHSRERVETFKMRSRC
ncbi:hypothetical protein JYU34_007312 [Plutella xylostella]|uniref:Uncharacterized protein n=1 Tax=Plutella xylostella TaxID=51655 RepID=A0ABQ7QQ34_PLUXY|nr:hypothetical protein JYU34_007312 [Plutella xylostella]